MFDHHFLSISFEALDAKKIKKEITLLALENIPFMAGGWPGG